MGTKGLLGFIIAGQRYAAYNQYNAYPQMLGNEIIIFLLKLNAQEWQTMRSRVQDIEWVDEKSKPSMEIQEKYIQLGFHDLTVADQTTEDWYCLLRKVQGGKALDQILNGNLTHLVESVSFLEDDNCEWAYFIDFEKEILETWASGDFLESIPLKGLTREAADKYMKRMIKKGSDENFGSEDDFE